MNALKYFFTRIQKTNISDLMCFILIPTLLIYAPDGWYCKIPLLFLSILALVMPEFRRSFWMWYVSALIIAMAIYFHWYEADNHKYILAYMCLALALAFYDETISVNQFLQHNARSLLVISMGFAVLWKLQSPDYLNEEFFKFVLLLDERFAAFSSLLTQVKWSELIINRDNLEFLKISHLELKDPMEVIPLFGMERIGWLAFFLTWWTILIEALIAIAFFMSFFKIKIADFAAHALLVLFLFTTYSVATVPAFCITLAILGICATKDDQSYFRPIYVGCALLVQVYSIPFAQMLS